MLRNYFTLALRQFARNRFFSVINVLGLSAGLSVSLLILLFVVHEKSYDKFHSQPSRIFKVDAETKYGTEIIHMDRFSAATAMALRQSSPDVAETVRMMPQDKAIFQNQAGKSFYEDGLLFADPSLLSVFSFKLLSGSPKTVLSQPNTLLLTPETAKKYFGNENPIGKTLVYRTQPTMWFKDDKVEQIPGKQYTFTIMGIIEPSPSNSSVSYRLVASFSTLSLIESESYSYEKAALGGYEVWCLLKDEKAVPKIEKLLNQLIQPPMKDVKLNCVLKNVQQLHEQRFLLVFTGIALLILSLAILNYISLTTARSATRAKEVGLRKVVGATYGQLIRQFFGESLFFTVLSFLLALLFIQLVLPGFHYLVGTRIGASFLLQPQFLWVGMAVFGLTAFLSGFYPALALSRFQVVSVLKGQFSSGRSGVQLRRLFIVFQFAVTISLLICSLVMQNQLHFMRTKDIGLNREQMLIVRIPSSVSKKYLALKETFKQQKEVLRISASTLVPFNARGTNMLFTELPDKTKINMYIGNVDMDFFDTYNIKILQKLPELNNFENLKNKIIVNEAVIKKLGWKNALGRKIPFGNTEQEIAGVVKDFHFMNLNAEISTLALTPVRDTSGDLMQMGGYLSVRLAAGADLPKTLTDFARIYKTYDLVQPFEYFFLDEVFNNLYKAEDRLAGLFKTFTGLAIFIACLGLLGLVTFMAERRTKEIGIRKVFGASVSQIVTLLSKDFLKLVLIALFIATPIAWYAMNKWLQDFAYRIDISWWIFALAGVLALLIALLTVSFQAIKAALANPVKSLRTE
jgi:putative ABC transport system permease protein